MAANDICLGVILLVLVIIIALVWRYVKHRQHVDRFSYATPATPRVRETVTDLFAELTHISQLSRSFEAAVKQLDDASLFAGARLSAAQLASALCNAERALTGSPPTYANYLAIYRGLTCTDAALLRAADSYVALGRHAHQLVADEPACAATGGLAGAGATLLEMGGRLRRLVVSVHRLGVALDVE